MHIRRQRGDEDAGALTHMLERINHSRALYGRHCMRAPTRRWMVPHARHFSCVVRCEDVTAALAAPLRTGCEWGDAGVT